MLSNNKKLIVCITGASSGIGKELSKQLIYLGHSVIAIARRKNLLQELENELGSKNFYYYEADVSDLNEIKKIKENLLAKNILPDTIVCCASIYENDTYESYSGNLVRKIFEINFFGTANIVEIFLPEFLKRNNGHFITLSSIASSRPSGRGVAYPASKAAVGMLFRGLYLRYKPSKVSFSTLYLGPVATEMWEGKHSFVVATPYKIAKRIIKLILNPKPVSFAPFLSTTLSRISVLIPDWLYARLSSILFK